MWLLDSAMNKQQRIRVRVNGRLTSAYSRDGGAPQGAVLTPAKYNGAKSPLQASLEKRGMGVRVGETTITGVGYADDTANLEESEHGMENILRAFAKESARIGNRYKLENQRVITFGINGETRAKWKMGDIDIDERQEGTFLGRTILQRKVEGTTDQVKKVILQARKASIALQWTGCYLENRHLALLIELYKSRVESILIAGTTHIQMDAEKERTVDVLQASIARRWAAVSRRVPKRALLAELGWRRTVLAVKLAKIRLWERMKTEEAGRYSSVIVKARMQQVEEGERRGLVYEARKILRELGKGTEWKRMDGVNTDMRREQMKKWFRAREIEEWKRWSAGRRMYAKIKSKWGREAYVSWGSKQGVALKMTFRTEAANLDRLSDTCAMCGKQTR
jgi:hypothetical protein